ncbi:MAG TPA: histidine phosphatase family protein [Parvularculaceae bacterium]|nr:histidine phosphatase family protein [Caulobacterales bacterium]HPE30605.1 histidine phosphatase family protein [Parvularculaceae bacterium]HRX39993.1 histidine phosphatase family protein [Parvularculaceae bacterium]
MKTVSLLRHAKSSWEEPEGADIDRPLNDRGRKAAPQMGAYLAATEFAPDIVLCSSAKRTRQTLELIMPSLTRPKETRILDALYEAMPGTLLAQVQALPDHMRHVLIVGHNPGLEMLAADLVGAAASDPHALKLLKKKYPTGAFARFEFDAPAWKDIAPGMGRLVAFVRPNDLDKD